MFDETKVLQCIEKAIPQYTDSPVVVEYLESVYDAITDGEYDSVTVLDLRIISRLIENGRWLDANYAQNTLYKAMEKRGNAECVISY